MKCYESEHLGRLFKIQEDLPAVGAYLFIYEGGKDMYDYLQNSVIHCMEFAAEEFGVPMDSWSELISDE